MNRLISAKWVYRDFGGETDELVVRVRFVRGDRACVSYAENMFSRSIQRAMESYR
jgi:hypothetical protein